MIHMGLGLYSVRNADSKIAVLFSKPYGLGAAAG
jgi:hypothetical protein